MTALVFDEAGGSEAGNSEGFEGSTKIEYFNICKNHDADAPWFHGFL